MSRVLRKARITTALTAVLLLVGATVAWGDPGDPLVIGQANDGGGATTSLTSTSGTGTLRLFVTGGGSGPALRADAENSGNGIVGGTHAPGRYGFRGANFAPSFGAGAGVFGDGRQNHGVVATTNNASDAYAVLATHNADGGTAIRGEATGPGSFGVFSAGDLGTSGALVSPGALNVRVGGERAFRLEPTTDAAAGDTFAPSVIGGGPTNEVTTGAYGATIAGGGRTSFANQVTDAWGTVGGGFSNQAGNTATVPGGANNAATQPFSFAAGQRAKATHTGAFVWADSTNADFASTEADEFAVRASGGVRVAVGAASQPVFRVVPTTDPEGGDALAPTVIAGGPTNQVWTELGAYGATISGGGRAGFTNRVTDAWGTVGGGFSNRAGDLSSDPTDRTSATVSGGQFNEASGSAATVGGGMSNTASEDRSTVGGGRDNTASDFSATVGGGRGNTASGALGTVGGGFSNQAGNTATVPGGAENAATQPFSFAAGQRAKATHTGSFVWADSTPADFASDRSNQFKVRAAGGMRLVAGSFGLNPAALRVETASSNGVAIHATQSSVDAALVVGNGGTGDLYRGFSGPAQENLVFRVHNDGAVTAKSFNATSDRALKTGYREVDAARILEGVASLPLATWSFRDDDPSVRHLGPTAQDFHAAFGVGEDHRHITAVDADGVALAAIQGLNQKLETQVAELTDRLKHTAAGSAATTNSPWTGGLLQAVALLALALGIAAAARRVVGSGPRGA